MQMDGRLDTLLSVLSEEEYVNLDTAAKKLQISQRTARTLVSQLGELLERHGAAIERRRGHGIRIMVRDRGPYQEFVKRKTTVLHPETGKQRTEFILARFFSSSC